MNDFTRSNLNTICNDYEEAGVPNEPFDVTVNIYGETEVTFKLGVVSRHGIVYAERSSSNCTHIGSLCHRYYIDGIEYNLCGMDKETAYQKWLEIIRMKNGETDSPTDIDELIF